MLDRIADVGAFVEAPVIPVANEFAIHLAPAAGVGDGLPPDAGSSVAAEPTSPVTPTSGPGGPGRSAVDDPTSPSTPTSGPAGPGSS